MLVTIYYLCYFYQVPSSFYFHLSLCTSIMQSLVDLD